MTGYVYEEYKGAVPNYGFCLGILEKIPATFMKPFTTYSKGVLYTMSRRYIDYFRTIENGEYSTTKHTMCDQRKTKESVQKMYMNDIVDNGKLLFDFFSSVDLECTPVFPRYLKFLDQMHHGVYGEGSLIDYVNEQYQMAFDYHKSIDDSAFFPEWFSKMLNDYCDHGIALELIDHIKQEGKENE